MKNSEVKRARETLVLIAAIIIAGVIMPFLSQDVLLFTAAVTLIFAIMILLRLIILLIMIARGPIDE